MAGALVPLLLIGGASYAGTKMANAGNKQQGAVNPATTDADKQTSTTAEEDAKSSAKAAAYLKSRNAQGFGPNPNKAKPFLLSL